MIKVTDLRQGRLISLNNLPHEILSYSHSKLSRGGAIVKTKLKNLKSGSIIDKTFKGEERVLETQLDFANCQFLYSSGEDYYFMDSKSFNQFSLSRAKLNNKASFLKEGSEIKIAFQDNEPISINLPIKINFEVTDTEPGVRGNTASQATKKAVIETGFKLQVHLFIKKRDIIKIDTRDGRYLERVR